MSLTIDVTVPITATVYAVPTPADTEPEAIDREGVVSVSCPAGRSTLIWVQNDVVGAGYVWPAVGDYHKIATVKSGLGFRGVTGWEDHRAEEEVSGVVSDNTFTPDDETDWSTPPETVPAALDTLAADLTALEGVVETLSGDVDELDGGALPYTPGAAGDWDGTAPTTVGAAIDRLAAVVKALNSGTGA